MVTFFTEVKEHAKAFVYPTQQKVKDSGTRNQTTQKGEYQTHQSVPSMSKTIPFKRGISGETWACGSKGANRLTRRGDGASMDDMVLYCSNDHELLRVAFVQ